MTASSSSLAADIKTKLAELLPGVKCVIVGSCTSVTVITGQNVA